VAETVATRRRDEDLMDITEGKGKFSNRFRFKIKIL
jgi:hypothetical protein